MEAPIVYDKAKYHFESIEENGLPEIHAYIHTGMFLGWLIESNLIDDEFLEDFGEDIPRLKRREITSPELFSLWDGALVDDMLNEEGNKFTQFYFDFENGQYINDYENNLANDLPSIFHVQDTWENYEKARKFINIRYNQWKSPQSKKLPES